MCYHFETHCSCREIIIGVPRELGVDS
uniref:Uncharacterized protein n=1 Tax=Heterorhabditis bacteriophora TaxID=37862 RepID=A0A1I7W8Y5_HETBA